MALDIEPTADKRRLNDLIRAKVGWSEHARKRSALPTFTKGYFGQWDQVSVCPAVIYAPSLHNLVKIKGTKTWETLIIAFLLSRSTLAGSVVPRVLATVGDLPVYRISCPLLSKYGSAELKDAAGGLSQTLGVLISQPQYFPGEVGK